MNSYVPWYVVPREIFFFSVRHPDYPAEIGASQVPFSKRCSDGFGALFLRGITHTGVFFARVGPAAPCGGRGSGYDDMTIGINERLQGSWLGLLWDFPVLCYLPTKLNRVRGSMMNDLTRRQAMSLAATAGAAVTGAVALGSSDACAQDVTKTEAKYKNELTVTNLGLERQMDKVFRLQVDTVLEIHEPNPNSTIPPTRGHGAKLFTFNLGDPIFGSLPSNIRYLFATATERNGNLPVGIETNARLQVIPQWEGKVASIFMIAWDKNKMLAGQIATWEAKAHLTVRIFLGENGSDCREYPSNSVANGWPGQRLRLQSSAGA